MSALRQLFAIIDGPNAADCVGLLAADLRFSVVFSTGQDGAIRQWKVATRQPLGEPLATDQGPLLKLAVSPDGTTLATG